MQYAIISAFKTRERYSIIAEGTGLARFISHIAICEGEYGGGVSWFLGLSVLAAKNTKVAKGGVGDWLTRRSRSPRSF